MKCAGASDAPAGADATREPGEQVVSEDDPEADSQADAAAAPDPAGPELSQMDSNVMRGGGYNNHPTGVTCTSRSFRTPGYRGDNLGFRVALDVTLPASESVPEAEEPVTDEQEQGDTAIDDQSRESDINPSD